MSEHVILKCLASRRENPYVYFLKAEIVVDPNEKLTREQVINRELQFQRFMGAAATNLPTLEETAYFETWEKVAREVYKKNIEILYVPAILHFVDQSKGIISGWAPDLTGTPISGRARGENTNFKFD